MLLLADLKNMYESELKEHLIKEYEATPEILNDLEILIGYESVGSWGCDSNSFFLFKDKEGIMYEVHGSHCSCMGFEGQFNLEQVSIDDLKYRINTGIKSVFYTGGYDSDEVENINLVNKYILNQL